MLVVASSISVGVSVTHSSCSMKGLVYITNIVDDQTECEGLLVLYRREMACYLLIVGSSFVVTCLHEEVSQSIESLNIVLFIRFKFGIVLD
jgi:hypothetical protein